MSSEAKQHLVRHTREQYRRREDTTTRDRTRLAINGSSPSAAHTCSCLAIHSDRHALPDLKTKSTTKAGTAVTSWNPMKHTNGDPPPQTTEEQRCTEAPWWNTQPPCSFTPKYVHGLQSLMTSEGASPPTDSSWVLRVHDGMPGQSLKNECRQASSRSR